MNTKKRKTYLLPPKAPPPSRGTGFACDVKLFPDSKPGFSGPPGIGFAPPAAAPPTGTPISAGSPTLPADIQLWVDHYVRVVGYYISRLNGLQFNLDEEKVVGPPNTILRFMSEELDRFAGQLHIGDPAIADASNPPLLAWPLSHSRFRFNFDIMKNGVNFKFSVELVLQPEVDPDTLMCVNGLVIIRITDNASLLDAVTDAFKKAVETGNSAKGAGNPDFISSSSSYLATSSSSFP